MLRVPRCRDLVYISMHPKAAGHAAAMNWPQGPESSPGSLSSRQEWGPNHLFSVKHWARRARGLPVVQAARVGRQQALPPQPWRPWRARTGRREA